MSNKTKGLPILLGEIQRQGTAQILRVWCPFCATTHQHQWKDGRANRLECRRPHCSEETPFSESGYQIGILRRGIMEPDKASQATPWKDDTVNCVEPDPGQSPDGSSSS